MVEASRKVSASSARSHTRKSNHGSHSVFPLEMAKRITGVFLVGLVAWAYRSIHPPPPRICGSLGGPPLTAPRIKLRDGRHLAYKEHGVPKEMATRRIIFVHPFGSSRHDVAIATNSTMDFLEQEKVYVVSFDRPGYGESDPNPKRTVESLALDMEELADQLVLGSKFYVIGFSMGGHAVWGCLKYIPHRCNCGTNPFNGYKQWTWDSFQLTLDLIRFPSPLLLCIYSLLWLAGAALLAPVVNYWWPGFPSNLSTEAYYMQPLRDQWALRISHYAPWLTYWWNSQNWFPASSAARGGNPAVFSRQDLQLLSSMLNRMKYSSHVKQQGEFESIHRDMMIGFGRWEFDPMDLKNPFSDNVGSVHLWQGDDDKLVPVMLQSYIARRLPWIRYHVEVGAGHLFVHAQGTAEKILKTLLLGEK